MHPRKRPRKWPRKWFVYGLFFLALSGAACSQGPAAWVRSELYFGLSMPDGRTVSDEQWAEFVDAVVTPRFPEGLTVLDAAGQYRNDAGLTQKEPSRVLVVLYPTTERTRRRGDLHAIAAEYARRFDQQSVLYAESDAAVAFIGPPAEVTSASSSPAPAR